MTSNTNYRQDLTEKLAKNGETWADVESHTLSETQLDELFDHGYGCSNGAPFTLWTKNHVYFPAVYDGAEWIAFVPRHPNGRVTEHVGQ
jgi:hypothetical protein